jgi:hypothetical protein
MEDIAKSLPSHQLLAIVEETIGKTTTQWKWRIAGCHAHNPASARETTGIP